MKLPDVALRWTLEHAISSDVETARLSNVCVDWRSVVKLHVLECSTKLHNGSLPLLPSMIACIRRTQSQNTAEIIQPDYESTVGETFCVAWFHPGGVQEVDVALNVKDDVYVDELDDAIPTNISSQSRTQLKRDIDAPSRRDEVEKPDCAQSRSTLDVADPERYAICAVEWQGYRHPVPILQSFGYTKGFLMDVFRLAMQENDAEDVGFLNKHINLSSPYSPTFAVRGAVVARPESYCMCVLSEGRSNSETEEDESNGELILIQQQEAQISRFCRQQRNCELRREVLPRVIQPSPFTVGRKQRCVQFLNAKGSHAVCMMTPPFDCGPVEGPITIFIIGIATEDGCFVSGLYHRFELGHLHPEDSTIEETEMSPVCMATSLYAAQYIEDTGSPVSYSLNSYNDERSSSNHSSGESISKCNCVMQGSTEKLACTAELEDDAQIVRGKSGPGRWHCYTFVADGCESSIRIDGVPEPMSIQIGTEIRRREVLDGLTIGSDHCFNVSLCCGHGSGGEGEGAIAEIAVFRGILDPLDVQTLEHRLMIKHGIPRPSGVLWNETNFERYAHALYTDPRAPQWTEHVPLRFMARHRSVAWSQRNPVTGRNMQISKIGCHASVESSDWDD
jgi:hypothetical protein